MIVVVAPYSPAGSNRLPNLGAARKIETLISVLCSQGHRVLLVNTSHDGVGPAPLELKELVICGENITQITPPLYKNRRIGKLLNIFDVNSVLRRVLKIGTPELVWMYNGYAFEAKFGTIAKKKYGIPIFLEFEDWHFSRGRGINPKPLIDWVYWWRSLSSLKYASAVNSVLASRLPKRIQVSLLPGVVAPGISDLITTAPPFDLARNVVRVGYFGGLSVEKGADQVLSLVERLPPGFKLVVTGSGALEDEFIESAKSRPAFLEFHGRVGDSELLSLIGSCDVLLNPHSPISSMKDGVFPFKVIEGVASGRLMISTRLPAYGLDSVLAGVVFVEDGLDMLFEAVVRSRALYYEAKDVVAETAYRATLEFGTNAVLAMAATAKELPSGNVSTR